MGRDGSGWSTKFYVGRCVDCFTYYVAADRGCPPHCQRAPCTGRVVWQSNRCKITTPEYVQLDPPPEKEPWQENGST